MFYDPHGADSESDLEDGELGRDARPILLTQPEKDRWTPRFLSALFPDKIEKVPVTKTVLRNGSNQGWLPGQIEIVVVEWRKMW